MHTREKRNQVWIVLSRIIEAQRNVVVHFFKSDNWIQIRCRLVIGFNTWLGRDHIKETSCLSDLYLLNSSTCVAFVTSSMGITWMRHDAETIRYCFRSFRSKFLLHHVLNGVFDKWRLQIDAFWGSCAFVGQQKRENMRQWEHQLLWRQQQAREKCKRRSISEWLSKRKRKKKSLSPHNLLLWVAFPPNWRWISSLPLSLCIPQPSDYSYFTTSARSKLHSAKVNCSLRVALVTGPPRRRVSSLWKKSNSTVVAAFSSSVLPKETRPPSWIEPYRVNEYIEHNEGDIFLSIVINASDYRHWQEELDSKSCNVKAILHKVWNKTQPMVEWMRQYISQCI